MVVKHIRIPQLQQVKHRTETPTHIWWRTGVKVQLHVQTDIQPSITAVATATQLLAQGPQLI